MKKFLVIVCVLAIAFASAGCGTIKIKTASGAPAYLMSDKGPAKEVRTKMVWYILWGLVPLGDNTTADMIKAKEKVSVKTEATFIDGVITALLGFVTITTRTVEVTVH